MRQTALILGANSDIAEAISKVLAEKGYNLILASRNVEALQALGSDLSIRYNVSTHSVRFDATDVNNHTDFYKSLKEKPELVIVAFGYLGDQEKAEKNLNETEKIINTNYLGAISILNVVSEDFKKRKNGCIVGISSVAGERGRQSNFIYGSAKAGFTAYLSGLRNKLFKYNIHVLTVKPGFVKTKMLVKETPEILTASPEKVAKVIYAGINKKKNVIYVLSIWSFIMFIIRNIPEFIFKRMDL